jgi:hypothetical protein
MAAEGWTPEKVRSVLAGESPGLVSQRRAFLRIPSPPRCKLCAAPFGGLGGLIFSRAGYRQSAGNPALCTRCITVLRKRQMTGVEVPVSLLWGSFCHRQTKRHGQMSTRNDVLDPLDDQGVGDLEPIVVD